MLGTEAQSGGAELLERERELELLTAAMRDAAEDAARVVVIEGDAGLGKSSLLACAQQLSDQLGFTVLRGRGGSLERTLGWGVARQLFEGFLARATASDRRSLLRGSASLAAPVLGLGAVASAEPGPVKDFRNEHGLYWLVCNLADRGPLALLIDDVQWCDDATLEWLLYLIRRSEGLRLLVVLATRREEPDAPTALLDLICAEPCAHSLALSPLGVLATEALLQRAYGSPPDAVFAKACHAWTGGNPLFVAELAAQLAAEGIEPVGSAASRLRTLQLTKVARVTMLRLGRLSDRALRLARAVAVLEPTADLHNANELSQLSTDEGVTAFDELVDAGVIADARPLAFVHPLTASVVYEDLPAARRSAMHKSAARLLARASSEGGLVAAHLLRTAPAGDDWVVNELRKAAAAEAARGSPSTAAEFLLRACSEPPSAGERAEVLFELGLATVQAGDAGGVQTLRDALAISTGQRERAAIALQLGRVLLWGGDPQGALTVAREAADEIGWSDADLRLQLEAVLMSAARAELSLVAEIPVRLRLVLDRTGDDSYGARLILAQLCWGLTAIAAPAERSVEVARRALDSGRLIRESPSAPDAYLAAIHMLTFNDELAEADELFGKAIELAQLSGSAAEYVGAACFRSYAAYLLGDLERAEVLARDAVDGSQGMPAFGLVNRLAPAYLALALIARGAVQEARQVLDEDPLALEHSPVTWASEVMFAAGCQAVAQGRIDEGAALLLACGRRGLAWGVVSPAWLPWRSDAALALHRLGEGDEAVRLCEEELRLARQVGARRPIGIALRARGLIEGEAGIEQLRESADVLAGSAAVLERARTLVALGGALRRANSRSEAREPLTEGLLLAEQCGAMPLAAEARAELEAAGGRPRSVMRTGTEALTASERRVCALAASGKSNPEIAQLLFVTRATIESHLHSAYRKLDITSRNELAAILAAENH